MLAGDPVDEEDYFKLFGTPEERFFTHHFSNRAPTLYHYTRQEGFIPILSARVLRATNIRHFSDYSEVEYAYQLLTDLISHLESNTPYGLEQGFLELLRSQVTSDAFADSYVLCFSTKFDDLNQWRSYASPGLGYCIGFASHHLEALAKRYVGRVGRCIYSRKEQETIVRELLAQSLRNLESYFPHYGPGDINEGLAQARVSAFGAYFSRVAPLFKNPAFADESEVRLVFDGQRSGLPILFRSGSTSIVPFIELSLAVAEDFSVMPASIMIKACSNPVFVAHATRRFLQHNGYERELVGASAIPYREGI
jgi:Protein of unknown function (DUF2971)